MDRALNAEERQICWAHRDVYFDCLDKNKDNKEQCKDRYETFEKVCPRRWVKYFITKRQKDLVKLKLQTEGEGFRYTDTKS